MMQKAPASLRSISVTVKNRSLALPLTAASAMGTNLPLFSAGEGDGFDAYASEENPDLGRACHDNPEKSRFRILLVWWSLLILLLPLRAGIPARLQFGQVWQMRAEAEKSVEAIEKSLTLLRQRMDWETAPHRLEEFNARVEDPTLWDDPDRAQKLMRDRQILVDAIERTSGMAQELSDSVELIELGEMEDDAEVVSEAEAALKALADRAAAAEIEALLNGEADANDTFLEINSGAGGTESCDWASMLARMYLRWAEKRGYKVELQSESPGEEAGIKSAPTRFPGTTPLAG